jgi:hypothetical protein
MFFHPQPDLLRAPFLADLFLNPFPGLGLDTPVVSCTPAQRLVMSLFWTIAALTSVSPPFSAYSGFVDTYYSSNLSLIMAYFQQGINLVSLFLGKLVVAHKHSFDFQVSRGLYYTGLPLSTFKVALTS